MKKTNQGIALIKLIILIIAIIILIFAGIFVIIHFNQKDENENPQVAINNTQQQKNNSNAFLDKNYKLVYDLNGISQSFWNETNATFSMYTNKELFDKKYTSNVVNNTESNINIGITPHFTMYSREEDVNGKGYIKVDFNINHAFYPNKLTGSLSNMNSLNFYILDNYMNFNVVSTNYRYSRKTLKEKSNDSNGMKVIYEDNNWQFATSNYKTIYANCFINYEEKCYLEFAIYLADKLEDENELKKLFNSFITNIQVSTINDTNIIRQIENTIPKCYLELDKNNEKIKLGNDIILNLNGTKVRTLENGSISWYDSKWKDGKENIAIEEKKKTSEYNLISILSKSNEYEIKESDYNNIKYYRCYMTEENEDSSYAIRQGASLFDGIFIETDNNTYRIRNYSNLKEEEIEIFIKYLFDNVISH